MYRRLKNRAGKSAIPITPVKPEEFDSWVAKQPATAARWVRSSGYAADRGMFWPLPDRDGNVARIVFGANDNGGPWPFAILPVLLPLDTYRIDPDLEPAAATEVAFGWALGTYVFDRYRTVEEGKATLVWPKGANRAWVQRTVDATFLARDLINTPASDMGPEELTQAVRKAGRAHGAKVTVITGDALLRSNYPAVHAVGRASARVPRLADLRWGSKGPRVTLIGKGVCFDSGGLDLKPASGMKLMKKDMAGAAQCLALATMVMAAKLPVRLRLLIPAVENSVAGNAMRPLDVLQTRKGLSVEVGNTDAEGRLILCDALAEADRERPDLIIDCATLTGSARVALGADLPAMFCNDDAVANRLIELGVRERDAMWRLPLHQPYRGLLDSKVADLSNVSEGAYAGAITAALFLESFVSKDTPWVHLDLMAWNTTTRLGRPVGGEPMGMRALYALIEETARR